MARIVSHGGFCCGMRHLAGFNSRDTEESIREEVRKAMAARAGVVEVVLTNRQCREARTQHIPEILQRVGFKLVSRFKNPNSGNICNVFHYNQKDPRPFKHLPFKLLDN